MRRLSFALIAQKLGLSLAEIAAELATLPLRRAPTRQDWQAISHRIRGALQQRIAMLERTRDLLDGCIGCGCLSLDRCKLYNPGDEAGRAGAGPRFLLGDRPRRASGRERRFHGRSPGALSRLEGCRIEETAMAATARSNATSHGLHVHRTAVVECRAAWQSPRPIASKEGVEGQPEFVRHLVATHTLRDFDDRRAAPSRAFTPYGEIGHRAVARVYGSRPASTTRRTRFDYLVSEIEKLEPFRKCRRRCRRLRARYAASSSRTAIPSMLETAKQYHKVPLDEGDGDELPRLTSLHTRFTSSAGAKRAAWRWPRPDEIRLRRQPCRSTVARSRPAAHGVHRSTEPLDSAKHRISPSWSVADHERPRRCDRLRRNSRP